MADISELEKTIGYSFKNKSLITQAMTHSSYANTHHMKKHSDNERLEFLGDAVLEVVSSEFLYDKFPDYDEGSLSKLRASLVCEPTLSYCTEEIDLEKYILLSDGEEKTGGRKRKSIRSDAMEALIGALFLDGGMEVSKSFILKYILTDIEHKRLYHDCKTALQEVVQSMHKTLHYELVGEEGPDHMKTFYVNALVDDEIIGQGKGNSKKSAEQEAAFQGMKLLKKNI
ncbi:MAG: ribonuclease III [Lachnospiraceae bacterium]|nr:ribonuclease III [Lachnospiraceae bacterium]